jgi:ABC-type polysaccharide/polyol phosphate transport system ATPase subunit
VWAIKCQSVSKSFLYPPGSSITLRGLFLRLVKKEARINGSFYALRDFDLEVQENETVGLIGRNGSGKSTALKLISKIYRPTTGNIETQGKVIPLIELGASFHPELTGRENIYLSGSIMGLNKKEIEQQFDRIVSFSELKRFLNTPVKYYSTGMYARLGFSVAVFSHPDILLIDEGLAVGDERFRKRSLKKIKQLQREGKTILLASHDLMLINSICSRAIWLENGLIKMDGKADKVTKAYKDSSKN